MKEFLKKVKCSTAYEILKEQSAMIIFVATLLGSFVTLSTKINTYLYNLGRFTKLNIPIDLINTESFSFYDIVTIFAAILCYAGGILTVFCIFMVFKTGLSVAKIKYEIYGGKLERTKNTINTFITCVVMIVALFFIDSLTILISSPKSTTVAFVCGAFLIIFQCIYGCWFVKKVDNKIKGSTIKDDKEDKATSDKKENELTDEEVLNLTNRFIVAKKTMNYLSVILPVAVFIFFVSIFGVSNFISGQKSADNTKTAFQILVLDENEYVVLDKSGDSYILAKTISNENKDILIIDTSEQKIISIEEIDYKLKMFNQVILEDPK